jgi:hypothetical protein
MCDKSDVYMISSLPVIISVIDMRACVAAAGRRRPRLDPTTWPAARLQFRWYVVEFLMVLLHPYAQV